MKKINLLIILQLSVFSFFIQTIKAQAPPAVQWSVSDWKTPFYNGIPITQDQSGEDWWYGVKNYYTGSTQIGYVLCGYSEYRVSSSVLSDQFYWQNLVNYAGNTCFNYTEPDLGSSIGFDLTQIDCREFETANNKKGLSMGQIAVKDLNGNTAWMNTYNLGGDLVNVIQVSNGFIAIGSAGNTKSLSTGNPIAYYNSNGGAPVYFNCVNPNSQHAYVVKTDFNGNVIWEYLYGFTNSDGTGSITDPAYTNTSIGYNIIQASTGHLIITGVTTNNTTGPITSCDTRGFVLDLDQNGLVQNSYLAPIYPITPLTAVVPFFNEFLGITEIGSTGKYVVVGREFNVPSVSGNCNINFGTAGTEYTKAFAVCLNNNLTLNTAWSTNNPVFFTGAGTADPNVVPSLYKTSGIGPAYNSNIWNVSYHSTGNQILIPLISDCSDCSYTGAEGTCYLYRLDPTTGLPKSGGTNPSLLGYARAFDLRPDVHEDLDGGIIYSSTTKRASPPVTSADLGSYYSCITSYTGYDDYYDTDAYIGKFDVNGNKLWENYFDRQPIGTPRVPYPGDVKRKECIFKLSVADDGGYVMVGTSSQNMEDNYAVKLYNDCEAKVTYDITGSGNNITINSSNNLWTGPHKVLGTVIVPAGQTLTISGASTVIQFADTKTTGITTNITVQPGGRLQVLGGAKLTSITGCSVMWDGVILIGTPLSQTAANQSGAILNRGTIENARLGVSVGVQLSTIKNGAYIKADNFNFLNNNIDVQFFPYKAPLVSGNEPNNISYFNLCKFEGNKELNDPIYTVATQPSVRRTTDKHLWLNQVKGIKVIGCNFNTVLTGLVGGNNYSTDGRSYGIYSTDATFTVQRACNIINGQTGQCAGATTNFNFLRYGIYTQATNTLKTFNVTETNFTNCFASIYESGISYSAVDKNNFLITTTLPATGGKGCFINPTSPSCLCYFHYLNQCNGFSHQENNFSVTSSQQVYGTIFNNEGNTANQSYRNTYSGLLVSNQSQLTNGASGIYGGLQIQCNQSSSVTRDDIQQTSGAIGQQGICTFLSTTPANNTFSHLVTSSLDNDIKAVSSSTGFQYNYNNNPSTGPQLQKPFYVSSNIVPNPCLFLSSFNYANDCPSNFAVPCNINCQRQRAINYRQQADNIKQSLFAGDAPALYDAINGNTSPGNLKNLLMSNSPYLSDGVLIAYLQRPNTPPGLIKDVIIANSPVTLQVKKVIDNMGLPNGILNQINAVQAGASARQQQENLIAFYDQQAQYSVNAIIRDLLNETTIKDVAEQIKKWLEWSNSLISKTDLAQVSISTGDYTRAQTLIDSIRPLSGMSKMSSHLQNRKNLEQQNKTWYELNNDTTLKQSVMQIAADSLSAGSGNARSVLALVYSSDNYEVIEGDNNSGSRLAHGNNTEEKNTIINNSTVNAIAYPNPFNNELTVKYSFTEANSTNCVSLIEIATGRVFQQQTCTEQNGSILFNTESISDGLYFISVQEKNKPTTFIKVVNIKR